MDVCTSTIPANLSEYGPYERHLKNGVSRGRGAAFLDSVGGLIEVRAHEEKACLVGVHGRCVLRSADIPGDSFR